MVIFVCDPIYDLHADEHMRRTAAAVDAVLTGKPVPPQPPTRLPCLPTLGEALAPQ